MDAVFSVRLVDRIGWKPHKHWVYELKDVGLTSI